MCPSRPPSYKYQLPHTHTHTSHTYRTHSYEHTLSHTYEIHSHEHTLSDTYETYAYKHTLSYTYKTHSYEHTLSDTYETHTHTSTCLICVTISYVWQFRMCDCFTWMTDSYAWLCTSRPSLTREHTHTTPHPHHRTSPLCAIFMSHGTQYQRIINESWRTIPYQWHSYESTPMGLHAHTMRLHTSWPTLKHWSHIHIYIYIYLYQLQTLIRWSHIHIYIYVFIPVAPHPYDEATYIFIHIHTWSFECIPVAPHSYAEATYMFIHIHLHLY